MNFLVPELKFASASSAYRCEFFVTDEAHLNSGVIIPTGARTVYFCFINFRVNRPPFLFSRQSFSCAVLIVLPWKQIRCLKKLRTIQSMH
jgi:hypothetical protein